MYNRPISTKSIVMPHKHVLVLAGQLQDMLFSCTVMMPVMISTVSACPFARVMVAATGCAQVSWQPTAYP